MIKRLSSLPLQILFFVILPLLALLVLVAFGGVATHRSEMRDMIAEHNLQAVQGTAASLSLRLEQRRAVLAGLGDQAAGGWDASELLEASGWASELFDGGLALYTADGELLGASAEFPATLDMAGEGVVVLSAAGAQPARVAVVAGAGDADEPLAVGLMTFESLGIREALEGLHVSNHTVVLIASQAGELVYDSTGTLIGKDVSAELPHIRAALASGGADVVTTAEGQEVVVTSALIPAADWVLIHQEQWQAALSPLMRFSLVTPLVLIPGVLIAAGAIWFGLQQIVRPLQRLERGATSLAWGDYSSLEQPVGGIDEIQHLQDTLAHLAERIRSAQVAAHNYIGVITQAQEDERARLARELHDQTAQALVAIGHREQMLKRHLSDDPQAQALLSELREMTMQTLDDLRRIIRAMRPTYLEELGLVPALQMLVKDLGETAPHITAKFVQEGEPSRLPVENEMALYRVAQEALNNAWQHSGADRITLESRFTESGVTITVRDNGVGFEAPRRVTDLSERGHFGLMGMYERAALIGAELRIQSRAGHGTEVTVRISPVTDGKQRRARLL